MTDLIEKATEIIKEYGYSMITASHYNQLPDDTYNEYCLNMAKAIVSQVIADLSVINITEDDLRSFEKAIINYIQGLVEGVGRE